MTSSALFMLQTSCLVERIRKSRSVGKEGDRRKRTSCIIINNISTLKATNLVNHLVALPVPRSSLVRRNEQTEHLWLHSHLRDDLLLANEEKGEETSRNRVDAQDSIPADSRGLVPV